MGAGHSGWCPNPCSKLGGPMMAEELWAGADNSSDVPPESSSVFSGSVPQVGTDWDLEGPCRSCASRPGMTSPDALHAFPDCSLGGGLCSMVHLSFKDSHVISLPEPGHPPPSFSDPSGLRLNCSHGNAAGRTCSFAQPKAAPQRRRSCSAP